MRRLAFAAALAACGHPAAPVPPGGISIDRFSSNAGHLLVRSPDNQLPGPDQPIDLDRPPFLTQGLGPDGSIVRYHNFDVQPDEPALRYRIVRAGTHDPIAGQPDVVDVIPGDPGYSDFWRLAYVDAPADFAPGSITRADQLRGLATTLDARALDCPIVPRGTTSHAAHGVAPPEPQELFYRGERVVCLAFGDPLALDDGRVPTSPIYVTFARPGAFRTESAGGATPQTHNVVLSVPGDADYSPLWAVHIYDPAAFDRVHDEASAIAAPQLKDGPHVNCPVIAIGP